MIRGRSDLFHPLLASLRPTANFSLNQRTILCSRRSQALCYPVAAAFIPMASHSSVPLLPPNQRSPNPHRSPFLPLPAAFHRHGLPTLTPATTLPSSSSYASSPRPTAAIAAALITISPATVAASTHCRGPPMRPCC
ncbi:hypothetical protein GW17_00017718 [Ensete ventricosum]|nr:hypothetical protein GW17_00017718 [Ensete ventricosum]